MRHNAAAESGWASKAIISLELRVHVIDYSSIIFGHNYSDHKRILCFVGFRLG